VTAATPKQIGKYQLVDVLGEGAMGIVYRAYDQVLNRYLAIKVMNSAIGNNAQLRERFLREARAAGSLQHPNVVTIYDFGEADDHLFIAMEFVDGEDLSAIIKRRQEIPITTKLDVMIDVLNGLAYAHNRGVVHRDIKPANIRVTTDTRAKLMDFGIAYLQQSELTQSGVLMGTPQYMAPEQVSGGAITAATDVFAAGSVLYEFLTYSRPFEGDTLHVILYNIMSAEPPSLSEFVPNAPAALGDVLATAMAKDPAQRFSSAVEMSKALAAARQRISPSLDAATITIRTSHVPSLPPPATALRSSQIQGMIAAEVAKRQKRTSWRLAGGGAVLALALLYLQPWSVDRDAALAPPVTPGMSPVPTGDARSGAGDEPAPAGSQTDAGGEGNAVSSATSATAPASSSTAATRGEAGGRQNISGRAGAPPTQSALPPPARTQSDHLIQSVRATALNARRSAAEQGATDADLGRGDSVLRLADALIREGRSVDAGTELAAASVLWSEAARTARGRAAARQQSAPPPVAAAPPPIVSETTARPPVTANPRPEIERAIAAYAAALESRDVPAIRRAYPGITTQQQRAWEGFFPTVRSLRATHAITALSVSGQTASATISAEHETVNTSGRSETQRFSYQATLTRDGDTWRITVVR
jgi:serine/threonine-protein kinase